jgi:hypothetical protein
LLFAQQVLAASDAGVHVWQMLQSGSGRWIGAASLRYGGIGALSFSRYSAENKGSLDRANLRSPL